jgi:Mg2+ and Co2+ transporter CorA
MTPSIVHQATAMLAVLDRYNWRAFALVTGSPSADQDYFVDILRHLAETVHNKEWYAKTIAFYFNKILQQIKKHFSLFQIVKSVDR